MREAWERFRLPLAMTEVHLNCHREGQMNWFIEAWNAAMNLRAGGLDVRAVTAWSLLGAFNWNTLVTRDDGHYESGAFDVASGRPRPTALARVIRDLSASKVSHHPALQTSGWWRKSTRFLYPPVFTGDRELLASEGQNKNGTLGAPILITGGGGTLGRAFGWACRERELAHVSANRQQLDITRFETIAQFLQEHKPWAVVNAAGYVRVDEAEDDA
jgi:dTDP-4-dehydrorhamnose reductase